MASDKTPYIPHTNSDDPQEEAVPTSPTGAAQSEHGDGQTCDRCPAYAPWSIQNLEGDDMQPITRWFACNRHLALVLREGHWEVDAVEVRYMTAEEARDAL
jgi:hypothetical protein